MNTTMNAMNTENLTPISMGDVQLTMAGFSRYTQFAVGLVSEFKGTLPENTVQKEKAYLDENNNLIIIVNSEDGSELSRFSFNEDEFSIPTRH